MRSKHLDIGFIVSSIDSLENPALCPQALPSVHVLLLSYQPIKVKKDDMIHPVFIIHRLALEQKARREQAGPGRSGRGVIIHI